MNLIEILRENRLMKTSEEARVFEEVLEAIAEHPDEKYLQELHLVLDDECEHHEVMFGLVHFLESFDMQKQIETFIDVMPQLMITAPEWTQIIHYRIINNESACKIYQNSLKLSNQVKPHFLYRLLEESVKNQINSRKELVTI